MLDKASCLPFPWKNLQTTRLLKKVRGFINGKKGISVRDNEPYFLGSLAKGTHRLCEVMDCFFLTIPYH
jgi:hypothetical protein